MIRTPRLIAVAVLMVAVSTQTGFGGELPPAALTMGDAITRALQTNVAVEIAATRITEAQGSHDRRLSGYLPHVRIETPVAYQTRNLEAQGISSPNTPSVVGPFTSYDFRMYADQTLFDLQSWHSIKASEKDQAARRDDYEDVRSTTIRQVATQYLAAQYAQAQVETAESRLKNSAALEELARNQRDAGLADGLDVLRAQVQLANDRQNLLVAKNSAKLALLALARLIGMDMGTPITLQDKLTFAPLDAPHIDQAITAALERRPDYRSLLAQRESITEQIKSNRSRYLPKLVASGNYGTSGQELSSLERSGVIQASLVFILFDGDRTGERLEYESRLTRIEHQLADQRRGIEQDIREALLNLESAAQQVTVAQSGQELAERELTYAGDRFKEGVANNIEVISAQDALARAHDNRLHALVLHADAKIAMARALGATETTYRQVLGTDSAH